MGTLKLIFDFILSVVKVIFPGKNKGRQCRKDHPVPHHHSPDLIDTEGDGGSPGSRGSHPVDSTEVCPIDKPPAAPGTSPTGTAAFSTNRLMGHALIATAIFSYLYKMMAGM